MAFVGWALLLVARLEWLATSSVLADVNLTHHSSPSMCLPDQANALLKLKQSFFFDRYSTTTLPSWQAGTDCCLWEGVGCNNSSGHVTALNLSAIGLYSPGIDPALFNLTSLRLLDLSINDFGTQRYDIPSVGFEKLALLTHLNLSNIGINGQIPAGISKLKNLISLDLGSYVFTGDEEDCFKALAKSTPHLRVLSLEQCGLQGHINRSLKRLRSLVAIKLSGNYGEVSTSLFTLGALQALDLSGNQLSGPIQEFDVISSQLRFIDLNASRAR
ncbi:hypothetical protein QOZ80_1BG0057170 [Eleusine coracana subsp. coracana]|nr:hypothetical protein QOZ80_1BG0057170 [Eleusine coracana subsp. coracana]